MEFFDLVKNRHSARSFQNKEVEQEKIEKILTAANRAPSAGNLQAYKICVAKDRKTREELADAANQEFVAEAPIVLVFLQNPWQSAQKYGARGEGLYSLQDATIACAYAQLAAANLGLGSVWVGAFDEEAVGEAINGHRNVRPVALLPIGYPAEKPSPKPRRPLTTLVWEK